MGTDHPSMKLALILFTEVFCQRFFCSVEIWFLLNPWKTDQAFAQPDWHRKDVHLGHARGCRLCYNIRGLGWFDNQRLLYVERTLTRLSWHCSSLMLCQSQRLVISVLLHIGHSNSSLAAAVLLGTKCHSFGTGGIKPSTAKRLSS